MQAMDISLTGLDVEWRRMQVIAANIANGGSLGEGIAPARLVSGPVNTFESYLDVDPRTLAGVKLYATEAMPVTTWLAHEPNNPRADAAGFVSYPNVDDAEQMMLMMKTSHAYESNMVALNAARQMYAKALTLGRSS